MNSPEVVHRDLVNLNVPQIGRLEKTGKAEEPYRLLDPADVVVEPVAEWFAELQACSKPPTTEEPVSNPQLLTPEEKLADAKKLLSLPRIVVICGSTRFMTEMNEADLRETKAGKLVVKPGCDMKSPHTLWSDRAEAEALKVQLDDLHRAKIRLADEVLVVGDYIGDSTRAEIAYARSLGKPVRFTHPEVDPDA